LHWANEWLGGGSHATASWSCLFVDRRVWCTSRASPILHLIKLTSLVEHHEYRSHHENTVTNRAEHRKVECGLIGDVLALTGQGYGYDTRDETNDTKDHTECTGFGLKQFGHEKSEHNGDRHGQSVTQEHLQVFPFLRILNLATFLERANTDGRDRYVENSQNGDCSESRVRQFQFNVWIHHTSHRHFGDNLHLISTEKLMSIHLH